MQIAVSGSNGFIGSRLCARLKELGHTVLPLSRTPSSSGNNTIAWSPVNGLADPGRLNGFDAVIHLAGKSIADGRWSKSLKREIYDSRGPATRILAEQIANLSNPPPVTLSASAVGIYGNRGDEQITEDSSYSDDFLADVCVAWEKACTPLTQAGIRVAHPRLGIVLDPSGGALAKMLPLFKLMLGGRVGSGNQYVPWIAIEDVVAGLIWLLENKDAEGPYNFVAPNPITNREFSDALADALSRPAWFPAPAIALRTLLGTEMAESLVLGGCRAQPMRLLEAGFNFQFDTIEQYFAAQFT